MGSRNIASNVYIHWILLVSSGSPLNGIGKYFSSWYCHDFVMILSWFCYIRMCLNLRMQCWDCSWTVMQSKSNQSAFAASHLLLSIRHEHTPYHSVWASERKLPELQWNNKLTFPYGKCCITNSAAHSVHIHDHRMMWILAQSQTVCILRPFKIHLIASAIHGWVLFLSPCLPQEGSHFGQLITMQVCWANRRNGSNVSLNNIHKSQLNMILIMPHDVSWGT